MPREVKPLFKRDGELWIPQQACVGPWSPQALHGGPVAALCVSVAEALLPGDAFVTTRLTLDLVRPVPLAPLVVDARRIKEGRRVNLIEIEIGSGGRTVALAQVQRTGMISVDLGPLDGTGVELAAPPDSPEAFRPLDTSLSPRGPAPFFRDATDMRVPHDQPEGIYGRRPLTAWLRVFADLLPGEPLSPAAAVAAAADYGNALGSPEPPGTNMAFPNADLSVYLARTPDEAWVRMQPATTWLESGIGHTRCGLYDRRGLLGTSCVTLVLDRLGS